MQVIWYPRYHRIKRDTTGFITIPTAFNMFYKECKISLEILLAYNDQPYAYSECQVSWQQAYRSYRRPQVQEVLQVYATNHFAQFRVQSQWLHRYPHCLLPTYKFKLVAVWHPQGLSILQLIRSTQQAQSLSFNESFFLGIE